MRSMFRSVLLALVAVLALGAVVATAAYAEPEWLLNEKPVTETTPVTFSNGDFEWKTTTLLGELEIKCSSSGKGTVAPAGAGSITEFKLSKCTKIKRAGCVKETTEKEESTEWSKVLNLPWKTQLEKTRSAEIRNSIGGSINGTIAWEAECKIAVTKEQQKVFCEARQQGGEPKKLSGEVSETLSTLPRNPIPFCNSSEGTGLVYSNIHVKGPEGKALSFN